MSTSRLVAIGALAASLLLAGCPNPVSTFFDNLGLVPLPAIPERAYDLAASPDGTQLAFTSEDGLFLTDTQGAPARKLAASEGPITALGWAADGKAVLFMPTKLPPPSQPGEPKRVPGPDYEPGHLQAVDLATGAVTSSVAVTDQVRRMLPSPDGRHLLIAGDAGFTIYDAGAGTTQRIDGFGMARTVAWSPDGRYLAYVTYDSQANTPVIAVYDRTDGTSRRIDGANLNTNPVRVESSCLTVEERLVWTADGTGIQVVQHRTAGSFSVTTFGLDGQQRSDQAVEVGNPGDSFVECYHPSPGGQYVAAGEVGRGGIPSPVIGQVWIDLATGQVRRHSGEGEFRMWLGNSSRYVLRKSPSGGTTYFIADVKA